MCYAGLDSDEDIPMPDEPPPASVNDEDEITMPDGPPPPPGPPPREL